MRRLGVLSLVTAACLFAGCSGDTFEGATTTSGGLAGKAGAAGTTASAGGAGASGGSAAAGAGAGAGSAGEAGASGASSAGAAGGPGLAGSGGVAGAAGATGGGGQTGGGAAGVAGQGGGGPAFGFVVSNAASIGGFDPLAAEQIGFSGDFDTDADCASSKLGTCQEIAVPEGDLPLCVCRAATYKLGGGKLTGSRALVLLATKDIEITGTLVVLSGEIPRADAEPPGSGGSFATLGGNASAANVRGDETLQPLLAGQRGVGACDVEGGRGGGALQLSAVGSITIGATGVIQAGGKAGGASAKKCVGPGGGSGGAILLEAKTLDIVGAVAANGASGSGGGTPNQQGKAGQDALPAEGPALGAGGGSEACLWGAGGITKGGTGGDGAALTTDAKPGSGASEACFQDAASGGGGGGKGRVRLRYRNFKQAGVVSPKPSQITLPPFPGE